MQHPKITQRRWAAQFFFLQCVSSGVVLLGLAMWGHMDALISYGWGGLSYLSAQAIFMMMCFKRSAAGGAKAVLKRFYLGEAVKLLVLGATTYLILRAYHLQMLFFLLGWVVPHLTYVWGTLFGNEKNRERDE